MLTYFCTYLVGKHGGCVQCVTSQHHLKTWLSMGKPLIIITCTFSSLGSFDYLHIYHLHVLLPAQFNFIGYLRRSVRVLPTTTLSSVLMGHGTPSPKNQVSNAVRTVKKQQSWYYCPACNIASMILFGHKLHLNHTLPLHLFG